MTLLSISGLCIAMFLLAITPGPGVFATVSQALAAGFRKTLPVIAGIVVGDLVFLLLAIFGLAAIAKTFSTLFLVIKYLGAAYLIYLGVKLWRIKSESIQLKKDKNRKSGVQSFLSGLSITLGNPKVIFFYISFLPTFVDLSTLSSLDITIVGLVVSLVLGGVMGFYAYSAAKIRTVFTSKTAQTRMNRAAGTAMIGTGTLLLARS